MRFISKIGIALLALCLLMPALSANAALAEDEATATTEGEITTETPLPDIAALQAQVDEATALHDNAIQRRATIEAEMEETNQRIAKLKEQLPEARDRSNEAAKDYYRLVSGSNMFLEMIFGATSLSDFFAKVEYSSRANESLLREMSILSDLNRELEDLRAKLEASNSAAREEESRAEAALRDAKEARDAAEETALLIAEATAAATARAAEEAQAAERTPEAPARPDEGGEAATPTDPGAPEAPSEKQTFVNLWAPRIDAYLAGSPLEGYGYAFASAAYDYNVDPRWSPAIACLESSKGRYCFLPYNAWGWGKSSWQDWETAIFAHVHGLSNGYGYTISEEAAKKYCPPNWQHWYTVVSNQMALI